MSDVNPHYLDHVVALSQTSDIEASEDIVTGTGMKLLAKGTKIDAKARERLLQFRLSKPLENMMRVVGGTDPTSFVPVAELLLARHPLLNGICASSAARSPVEALRGLELTSNVQSLLSVYAGNSPGKLEHAVGVAMLSAAFGGGLSTNPADTLTLVIAGLTHDVGELYIDPAFLARGVKLEPQQWKYVTTHPIVGSHVLGTMPGAGERIASVVMAHHERLDGFGYPQGLRSGSLSMAGQVVAVSEMLMGLLEAGACHAERAMVAMKLVPGEFHRRFIDRVAQGSRFADINVDAGEQLDSALEGRIAKLASALQNVGKLRESTQAEAAKFGAPLRSLLDHAFARWERLAIALSSTGLDVVAEGDLRATLAAMGKGDRLEVDIVLRELQWRLGELERQLVIRSEQLSPVDAKRVLALVDHAKQPRSVV